MLTEFKVSGYITLAVCVISCFFYNLRPYLLETPPNPIALALVGLSFGLLLFCIFAGPVLLIRLQAMQRQRARLIFRTLFWAFVIGAVLGLIAPFVPTVVPCALLCYAIASLMLRGAAMQKPLRRYSQS